jgi:hypothetical protein
VPAEQQAPVAGESLREQRAAHRHAEQHGQDAADGNPRCQPAGASAAGDERREDEQAEGEDADRPLRSGGPRARGGGEGEEARETGPPALHPAPRGGHGETEPREGGERHARAEEVRGGEPAERLALAQPPLVYERLR